MAPDHYTILNLLLGLLVGVYGTLVGAGGGFLLVPLFLILHKMPHEAAVGTSLAIVAANAFSGAAGYVARKKVDYRAAIYFTLATLPGAVLGARLTGLIEGPVFERVFGLFLMIVSIYLLFRRPLKSRAGAPMVGRFYVQRKVGGEAYSYHEPLGVALSAMVGLFSSWLGIGGGILHVPLLTEILRFPVHIAVATSHFILAWTALVGAFMHASAGNWRWEVAWPTALGAILGAQVAVLISSRIKGSVILRCLAIGLMLVGIRLLFL